MSDDIPAIINAESQYKQYLKRMNSRQIILMWKDKDNKCAKVFYKGQIEISKT